MDKHVSEDFAGLLTVFKVTGLNIELDLQTVKMLYDGAISRQDLKGCDELTQDYKKILFPETKDQLTTLGEQLKQFIPKDGETMRVAIDRNSQVDSSLVKTTYQPIGG